VTYSMVARDPETGDLGVAVQSHWFAVGSIVSWGEAGIGVVATQSFVEPAYGPRGLDLMRRGLSAREALTALLTVDDEPAGRQVAMLDSSGELAVHTGGQCIHAAGHRTGEAYSAQANTMSRDTVWDAMAEAYEGASGDLAERLVSALEAAEREGGDIRGRQSAAVLVVRDSASGRPWEDRPLDLRVEDHPDPVPELRRLVDLARAYRRMNRGDERALTGDLDGALDEYTAAQETVPESLEMSFWRGVMLANAGRAHEARPYVEHAVRGHAGWGELLARLPASNLLRDPGLVRELLPREERSQEG
jgi:uncharacterized Ntn-hydrolase superfamily protein